MRLLPTLLSFLFLCNLPLWADGPDKAKKAKKAGELKPLTVDDILKTESAHDFQFAPDGKTVVWNKRAPDKEKNEFVEHLVLTYLDKKKDIPLTRGDHGCTSPRWSPNGDRIAFLSSRPAPKGKGSSDDDDEKEERTRLWLIDPLGGEPWLLTGHARDIRGFAWVDDDTLLFYAQEKKAALEKDAKENKDDSVVVDDEINEPAVRLFKVTVEDKKLTRLTHNRDRIQYLSVSPDGKHAVTIHDRSLSYLFDHKLKPAVFLHTLDKGEPKPIFTTREFNVSHVYWHPKSTGFYAVSQYTTHPDFLNAFVYRLYWFDLAKGEPTLVDLAWEHGLASDEDVRVTPDGFVTLLANGPRHKPARYIKEGTAWKRQWLEGQHADSIYHLSADRDGKQLLYLHTTASGPHQWHHAKLEKNRIAAPKDVFELAPDLESKKLAKAEIVRWKGALDEEIDGILYYPLDHVPGKRYPLVVQIHGGPAWADFDIFDNDWAYAPNLYAARGAFVLQPNYHGSTHHGLKFAESISDGKYYELPVADIEKGIDALIEKGLVDRDKIGLAGWSNGAILTMALITRRHYQAAAAGAGGSEWVSDWGVCPFGMSFSNYYLGKSPLEDPQRYFKNAPFYDFPKVKTPTLLFQGTDDTDVPAFHGPMQFRALRQLGKTDVRFVQFTGEKHSLKKLGHQKRKLTEELAWFDKHLFGTVKPSEPAFKPTSPLAGMLVRHSAKRNGKHLGELHDGTLIPEVVAHEALHMGRFEVTRAQFAAYDKTYAIESGTENFPANGITFEQAKAYCIWLSKLTGKDFRLGTQDEMEELYEPGEATENTLDYWAGYTINPDDRDRILPKIRELPGKAPLLKEVGTFPTYDKDTPLFDLGGNVAEWVVTPKGGRPLGGSADRAADDRSRPPAPEYIGFRVVRAR